MKRLKHAMKASVVRSDTSSKCTALVAKHTKIQTYDLIYTGFLVCPFLMSRGLEKYIPDLVDVGLGVTL